MCVYIYLIYMQAGIL